MFYRGSQLRNCLESQQSLWPIAQCCYCLEHGELLKLDSMHFALRDDHELFVVWGSVLWFETEQLPTGLLMNTWFQLAMLFLKALELLGGNAQMRDVNH